MNYIVKKNDKIDIDGVIRLFLDAGWKKYAEDKDKISRALEKSLTLYGAYVGKELVGYIRAIGDGETILYIQDLVVLTSYKRQGIGRALLSAVLTEYKNVRQKVLITDNNPEAVGFYESMDFRAAENMGIVAFLKFDE